MSTDLKLEALRLSVSAYGPSPGDIGTIVKAAEAFHVFLTGNTQAAQAGANGKATKATKVETPALDQAEAKTEVKVEPLTITQDQVKQAVIDLVNVGNKAAGNDKAGREYAGAVLAPFGAKNVSTIKPEDYAKVIEALQAKKAAIEEEAALTG